ncbi:hypothetical protein RB195_003220 [Necator americanus]|uniref:Uncharacterized protein n=1 Tax=Necator americanus TaxID=51031 RepID=A0ABR1DMJ9_NECAM
MKGSRNELILQKLTYFSIIHRHKDKKVSKSIRVGMQRHDEIARVYKRREAEKIMTMSTTGSPLLPYAMSHDFDLPLSSKSSIKGRRRWEIGGSNQL